MRARLTRRIVEAWRKGESGDAMTLPVVIVSLLVAQGPLAQSVTREAQQLAQQTYDPHGHWEEVPVRSPTLVWVGIGLTALGVVITVAAVTWDQQSDLSEESPNTRLNRDLAPCRTDPDATDLPIADCQVNVPLLATGLALTGAGGGLILWGAQPASMHPAVGFRVRF